jgi:hypothetical protein
MLLDAEPVTRVQCRRCKGEGVVEGPAICPQCFGEKQIGILRDPEPLAYPTDLPDGFVLERAYDEQVIMRHTFNRRTYEWRFPVEDLVGLVPQALDMIDAEAERCAIEAAS